MQPSLKKHRAPSTRPIHIMMRQLLEAGFKYGAHGYLGALLDVRSLNGGGGVIHLVDDCDVDSYEHRVFSIYFDNMQPMVIEFVPYVVTCSFFEALNFKPEFPRLIHTRHAYIEHRTSIYIEWDDIDANRDAFIAQLIPVAYRAQGYDKSVPRARAATVALMLSLRGGKLLPKDMVVLLGKMLYWTRYETKTWV